MKKTTEGKRTTVLLINGMEVYRISCDAGVNVTQADGVVTGLQNGKAHLIGQGSVTIDPNDTTKYKLHDMKYLDGTDMISPNRAARLVLKNVEKRHAFADCFKAAKLGDIMPVEVKAIAQDVDSAKWHVVDHSVNCINCGAVIKGTRRECDGKTPQKFHPLNKSDAYNEGTKWYCKKKIDGSSGCTIKATQEEIKELNDAAAKKYVAPSVEVTSSSIANVTITFNGSVTDVAEAIKQMAILMGGNHGR